MHVLLQSSVLIAAMVLAGHAEAGASPADVGAVEIVLSDPSGKPAAGLIVSLDGTDRYVVSDAHGVAHFADVPAGERTWSVAREVEVPDDHGRPVAQEFKLDNAIKATVLAARVVRVEVKVEIKVQVVIVAPGGCTSTPWCGVVGGPVPGGNLRVVTGGGVRGSCACTFAGGPVIPAACPGRQIVEPAAPGAHTITTTTCLGGPGCAPPQKAATCSIRI